MAKNAKKKSKPCGCKHAKTSAPPRKLPNTHNISPAAYARVAQHGREGFPVSRVPIRRVW